MPTLTLTTTDAPRDPPCLLQLVTGFTAAPLGTSLSRTDGISPFVESHLQTDFLGLPLFSLGNRNNLVGRESKSGLRAPVSSRGALASCRNTLRLTTEHPSLARRAVGRHTPRCAGVCLWEWAPVVGESIKTYPQVCSHQSSAGQCPKIHLGSPILPWLVRPLRHCFEVETSAQGKQLVEASVCKLKSVRTLMPEF